MEYKILTPTRLHKSCMRVTLFIVLSVCTVLAPLTPIASIVGRTESSTVENETIHYSKEKSGVEKTLETNIALNATKVTDIISSEAYTVSSTKNNTNYSASVPNDVPTLVEFTDEKINVFFEDNTFSDAKTITLENVQNYSPSDEREKGILEHNRVVKTFKISLDNEPDTFDKPVRLIADVSEYLDSNSNGQLYLAYKTERYGESAWVEVPTIDYGNNGGKVGLISADIDHFSEWKIGERPDTWQPTSNEPSIGTFTGDVHYTHPIDIPSGRGGHQPSIHLSYSTGFLKGKVRDSNVHRLQVADGWSIGEISIQRSEVQLEYDRNIDNPKPKYIHRDRYMLNLNGTGHSLVPADGIATQDEFARYYAQNAPGLLIYRHYDANLPNGDGIYWTVSSSNGTLYRLGYTDDSEVEVYVTYNEGSADMSHFKLEGYKDSNNPTHPGKPNNASTLEWKVDTVTDQFGNQIQYDYGVRSTVESYDWRDEERNLKVFFETKSNRLKEIRYNYVDRVTVLPTDQNMPRLGNNYATKIVFGSEGYGNEGDGQNVTAISPITNVYVYHGDLTAPMHEYRVGAETIQLLADETPNNDACELIGGDPLPSTTRVVQNITKYTGTNGSGTDGGYTLPSTTFTYESKTHHTQESRDCFKFLYLKTFDNGYGGSITYSYETDDRSEGIFGIANEVERTYKWPHVGRSYYVTNVEKNDGINPVKVTEYSYENPCYGQDEVEEGIALCPPQNVYQVPRYAGIRGFEHATVLTQGYQGELLGSIKTTYLLQEETGGQIFEYFFGKPTATQAKNSDDQIISESNIGYGVAQFNGDENQFVYTSLEENKVYEPYRYDVANPAKTTQTVYDYNVSLQGNQQFGLATRVVSFGDVSIPGDDNTTLTRYNPYTPGGVYWNISKQEVQRNFLGDKPANHIDSPIDLHLETYNIFDEANPHQSTVIQKKSGNRFEDLDGDGADGLQKSEESVFNVYGNIEKTIDKQGNEITFGYDERFNLYPVSATDDFGTTTLEYYGFTTELYADQQVFGLIASRQTTTGDESYYEYDPFGRLIATYKEVNDMNGNNFLADGNPVSTARYWDNTWNNMTTWLDPSNNKPFVISTESAPHNPEVHGSKVDVMYNGFGKTIQIRTKNREVHTENGKVRKDLIGLTAYDARGNVVCAPATFEVDLQTSEHPMYTEKNCEEFPHIKTNFDANGAPIESIAVDGSTRTLNFYGLNSNYAINANNVISSNFTNKKGEATHATETQSFFTESFDSDLDFNIWVVNGDVATSNGSLHIQTNAWGAYPEVDYDVHDTYRLSNDRARIYFRNNGATTISSQDVIVDNGEIIGTIGEQVNDISFPMPYENVTAVNTLVDETGGETIRTYWINGGTLGKVESYDTTDVSSIDWSSPTSEWDVNANDLEGEGPIQAQTHKIMPGGDIVQWYFRSNTLYSFYDNQWQQLSANAFATESSGDVKAISFQYFQSEDNAVVYFWRGEKIWKNTINVTSEGNLDWGQDFYTRWTDVTSSFPDSTTIQAQDVTETAPGKVKLMQVKSEDNYISYITADVESNDHWANISNEHIEPTIIQSVILENVTSLSTTQNSTKDETLRAFWHEGTTGWIHFYNGANNEPDWGKPVKIVKQELSDIPGEGPVQAQSMKELPNGDIANNYWRNNELYGIYSELQDGSYVDRELQITSVENYLAGVSNVANGDIRAHSFNILDGASYAYLLVWKGDNAYRQFIPINEDGSLNWGGITSNQAATASKSIDIDTTHADEALMFEFKTSGNASLQLESGTDSGYRSLRLDATHDLVNGAKILQVKQVAGNDVISKDLMPFELDTSYTVYMQRGEQVGSPFVVLVYETLNPTNFAEFNVAKDHTWKEDNWKFTALSNNGELIIDNYKEIEVSNIRYEYDMYSNLTKTIDSTGLETTTIEYDLLGRIKKQDDVSLGIFETEYDEHGHTVKISSINENGDVDRVTCNYFDTYNRGVATINNGTDTNCPQGYEGVADKNLISKTTYFDEGKEIGLVKEISWGPTHSENKDEFTYDNKNRLKSQTRTIAGISFTKEILDYDFLERPWRVEYPNGKIEKTTFDREGVDKVAVWNDRQGNTTIPMLGEVTYNNHGNIVSVKKGLHIYQENTYGDYTNNYLLEEQSERKANGVDIHNQMQYEYNTVGVIEKITDVVSNDVQTFEYDDRNRLISATGSGNQEIPSYNLSYEYDVRGNIVNKNNHETNEILHYKYENEIPYAVTSLVNENNEVVQTFAYEDGYGNITSRTEGSDMYIHNFNERNRIESVILPDNSKEEYFYDGGGQRMLIKIYSTNGDLIEERYNPFTNYEEVITYTEEVQTDPINIEVPNPGFEDGLWELGKRPNSEVRTEKGYAHTGENGVQISNLARGFIKFPSITIEDDNTITPLPINTTSSVENVVAADYYIEVQVKGEWEAGVGQIKQDGQTIHTIDPINNNEWQTITVPLGVKEGEVYEFSLYGVNINGWIAYDNFKVVAKDTVLFEQGFENISNITATPYAVYPATSIKQVHTDVMAAGTGDNSLIISNLQDTSIKSERVKAHVSQMTLHTWIRGSVDTNSGLDYVNGAIDFYDANDTFIETVTAWNSVVTGDWTEVSGSIQVPSGAVEARVSISNTFTNGTINIDDISLYGSAGELSRPELLLNEDFNDGVAWEGESDSEMPASFVEFKQAHGRDASFGYMLNNLGYVWTQSEHIPVSIGEYTVHFWLRGNVNTDASPYRPTIIAHMFDINGNEIDDQRISIDTVSVNWEEKEVPFNVTNSDVATIKLKFISQRVSGWMRIDDFTLTKTDTTVIPVEKKQERLTIIAAGTPIGSVISEEGVEDQVVYFSTNHLLSNNGLYDINGDLVEGSKAKYLPFGGYRLEPNRNIVGEFTNRGYTGHQHDKDTGLIYMNARYYLPEVGRFLSADTIVPDSSSQQSLNRYSYVRNNPIMKIDPTGHEDICASIPSEVSRLECEKSQSSEDIDFQEISDQVYQDAQVVLDWLLDGKFDAAVAYIIGYEDDTTLINAISEYLTAKWKLTNLQNQIDLLKEIDWNGLKQVQTAEDIGDWVKLNQSPIRKLLAIQYLPAWMRGAKTSKLVTAGKLLGAAAPGMDMTFVAIGIYNTLKAYQNGTWTDIGFEGTNTLITGANGALGYFPLTAPAAAAWDVGDIFLEHKPSVVTSQIGGIATGCVAGGCEDINITETIIEESRNDTGSWTSPIRNVLGEGAHNWIQLQCTTSPYNPRGVLIRYLVCD